MLYLIIGHVTNVANKNPYFSATAKKKKKNLFLVNGQIKLFGREKGLNYEV